MEKMTKTIIERIIRRVIYGQQTIHHLECRSKIVIQFMPADLYFPIVQVLAIEQGQPLMNIGVDDPLPIGTG